MLHFSKLFLIFSLAAWVQAAKPLEPMKAAPVLEKTLYFLDALELKEDIIPYFDSGFKTDLLVQQSRQTWDYLEKTYGGFNEAQGLLAYAKEHGTLVFGKLLFQKRAMGLKLSFSHALRIKHWEFIPVRNLPATVRRNRPYGKSADFSIENLKLGKKEESLGARLYLPKGVKSPPVLVLLHDFGPQDLSYIRRGRPSHTKCMVTALSIGGKCMVAGLSVGFGLVDIRRAPYDY